MSLPQSFVAVRVYVFNPGVSEAVKDPTPFRKVNGITLPFFVITICDAVEQLIAVNKMFAVFWVVVSVVWIGFVSTMDGAKHCLYVILKDSLSFPQEFLTETLIVLIPRFKVSEAVNMLLIN